MKFDQVCRVLECLQYIGWMFSVGEYVPLAGYEIRSSM